METRPPEWENPPDPLPVRPVAERMAKARLWKVYVYPHWLGVDPYMIDDPAVIGRLVARFFPADAMAEPTSPPDTMITREDYAMILPFKDPTDSTPSGSGIMASSDELYFWTEEDWMYGAAPLDGGELYLRLCEKDFDLPEPPFALPKP